MSTATDISNRIIEAVMARRLAPGARLGEQQLALLFDCSRTTVREALTRLSTRGIVTVSARRGWYVVEPSEDEARQAFEARRVIELGLLHQTRQVSPTAIDQLKTHLQREQAAIAGTDVGVRSYLLGDFHVCLAECLGNDLLAGTLRDLTARTTLIAMLYQSSHDAAQSCDDHVRIVAALEAGNLAQARDLMDEHIGTVQAALRPTTTTDPLDGLRQALAPVRAARGTEQARHLHTRTAHQKHEPSLGRDGASNDSSPDSTDPLGALL